MGSPVELKYFWLFTFFLGCSRSNNCKHWRRDLAFEKSLPEGEKSFFATTTALFQCSQICSLSESCVIFSYNQQTGACTGFRNFRLMYVNSSGIHKIPAGIFYKVVQFGVTVKTGTAGYAGTDSKVYLKIFGTVGVTAEIELVDDTEKHDKFENGDTDNFILKNVDVGKIQKIMIRHDNTLPGAGWQLTSVTVAINGQSGTMFTINSWLETATQLNITVEAP